MALAVLFAVAPARAEGETRVAIIDVQKVLRESLAVKALTTAFEAERGKYQEEIKQKEQELRDADQELGRQRSILSAKAFADKRSELQKRVVAMQQQVQKQKRSLDQRFSKGMGEVQSALAAVAQEIAESRNIDLVLSKATVVIVRPDLEITAEAIERLNSKLAKVDLPPAKE